MGSLTAMEPAGIMTERARLKVAAWSVPGWVASAAALRATWTLATVSGVGPKLAIKILSGLSLERTVQAIRGQDHAQLVRIPGVGKKLAERLVVELKDKLDDFAAAPVQSNVQGRAAEDVLSALVNLGYQRLAAEKAIEQSVAKDAALGADFDGLFRGALKLIR